MAESLGLVDAPSTEVSVFALSTLRDDFRERGAQARPPSTVRAVAVDFALACAAAFSLFYAVAFAFTRGSTATSAAAGAWALGVFLSLFIFRPLFETARVYLAFATHGVLRPATESTDVTPLTVYHRLIALPAAAAAACSTLTAPVDAAVALLSPEALAAVTPTDGLTAAHFALRQAALVQAYLALVVASSPTPLPLEVDAGSASDEPDARLDVTAEPASHSPTLSEPDEPVPLSARFRGVVLSDPDAWAAHLHNAGVVASVASTAPSPYPHSRAPTPRLPLLPSTSLAAAARVAILQPLGARSSAFVMPLPAGQPPSTITARPLQSMATGRACPSITVIRGVNGPRRRDYA